jgi:hypothetical protein
VRHDVGRIAHRATGIGFRREDRRKFAGPEGREEGDQDVQDVEQFVPDRRHHRPGDPTLVPPRGDVPAHVVEDTLQAAGGVKREGVGHLVSFRSD